MGKATIPKINPNLNSMPRIIVQKFHDLLTRTKVIAQKSFCLQRDDNDNDPQYKLKIFAIIYKGSCALHFCPMI